MDIKSQIIKDGRIVVLTIKGRFDVYEAQSVKSWFRELNGKSPKNVVVNLADVDFIDSSALATLVRGLKHCRQREGDLFLCGLQPQVHIIFELTRLDRAFQIFATEVEAIEAFNTTN